MKKCLDCDVEMIEDVEVFGQHPFEIGVDGESEMFIKYKGDMRQVSGLFGIKVNTNDYEAPLKARMCPKCGKVELYANLNENK